MLTTLLTAFVSIAIGHINGAGEVPHSDRYIVRGPTMALTLPPRTEVYTLNPCQWLEYPRVAVNVGTDAFDMPRPHWIESHTVEMFGRVAFDGIDFRNYSNHPAIVEAHVFNGCPR